MGFHRHLLCGAALCIGAGAMPVFAQTAADAATQTGLGQTGPEQTSSATSGGLEEILVTAQRREQRSQDIPISINAVTAAGLAAQGVSNIQSLQSAIPGLITNEIGAAVTPFLRGVGSSGPSPNNEPSVATYVDGVYMGAPFTNVFGFNNIERIEVLKGPQGTLFGRNATGGVVQVITRKPSHTPAVEMGVGYANYNTFKGEFYATAGLSDTIAFDIAGGIEHQSRGWGRNVTLNTRVGKMREHSIRSKLLFEPSDSTEITLAVDYSNSRSSRATYSIPKGNTGADGQPHYVGAHNTDADSTTIYPAKTWGGSIKLNQDLGFARLVSISARRQSRGHQGPFDVDGTSVPVLVADFRETASNWSQEVQLINPIGSKIDWLIGGFYFDGRAGYNPAVLASVNIDSEQKTRSASVYGQTTINITDQTRLTAGLRYTDEKQRFKGSINTVFSPPESRQSFSKLTWRAALDHKFGQNILGYVSYNRGVKSGGYDLTTPGGPGYRPEVLDAFEVGLKTELFDRKVRFNSAVFLYDYKDIQVSAINAATASLITVNAASARIKGIDLDLDVVPVQGLTISAAGNFLWGEYRDFPNPTVYGASIGQPPFVFPNNNARGFDTVRTPKFTGSLRASYAIESSVGRFTVNPSLSYNDGFFFDVDNRLRQDAYVLLNAAIDWQSSDGHLGANLWMRNITDKVYYSQAVPSNFGDLVAYASPRTYGLTLRAKF
mgnify:CR=1 FL=1